MEEFKGTNQTWHLNGLNGIQSSSGIIVGVATNDGALNKETVKANAQLMAAAPELLKALQDLWPKSTNAFGELSIQEVEADEYLNALSKSIDNAKAAISKALGLQ